jgi:spermidine/putrescine transport system ATP-binding protein
MSDSVAVMSQAVVEQIADGNTIYDKPESSFVASFVGENNRFSGKVIELAEDYAIIETPSGQIRAVNGKRAGKTQLSVGDEAYVFVRPESLKFADSSKFDNSLSARVTQQEFEGNFWHVFCDVEGSDRSIVLATINDGGALNHGTGENVTLGFNADLAIALPKGVLAVE